MDPLTHIVAGGAIAALIAPAGHRRAALLAGAVLATAPDIDVIFPYANVVDNFTRHRSITHSLFVVPLFAVALWAFALWRWPMMKDDKWRWLAAFLAAIVSHPLLDACNVYGTQLFWPLERTPTMGALLFIIDPLFTLPMVIGFIAAWRLQQQPRARQWLALGLLVSATYLGWSALAKHTIESGMRADLAARNASEMRVIVMPMPFTTILWRIVVMRPDGEFYEGYYSFIGAGGATTLDPVPGFRHLLADIADSPDVKRLAWFTDGFYAAGTDRDGRIVLKDIRMGAEPEYAFRFVVGERRDGRVVAVTPEALPWDQMRWSRYQSIWQRAMKPQTGGTPAPMTSASPE